MLCLYIRRCFYGMLMLAAVGAKAEELEWRTDLAQAQAQAKREQKSVLLVFHGSDWCPPCMEMQRQVLQAPEFIAYARQALVLVNVDFPETSKQSADLKRSLGQSRPRRCQAGPIKRMSNLMPVAVKGGAEWKEL